MSGGTFPLVTMGAILMTLGLTAIFLLYRYLKTLQHEHSLLSTLIDEAPVALFWCDEAGRIVGANARFLSLTGYRIEQLGGQEWLERILPNNSALMLRHRFKNGRREVDAFQTVIVKADGSWSDVVLEIHVDKKMGIVSARETGDAAMRGIR